MRIILLENVRNIGSIGEIKDVKRGFARNFLIAQKKALFASKENIKEVEKIKNAMFKEGACGDPGARRQQIGFTGMGRLHQNMVPDMHKADPTEIIQVKNIKDGRTNKLRGSWNS